MAKGHRNQRSSSGASDGSLQHDMMQTWLLLEVRQVVELLASYVTPGRAHSTDVYQLSMQFCDRGSLDQAILRGRFIKKADKAPDMVSKAW